MRGRGREEKISPAHISLTSPSNILQSTVIMILCSENLWVCMLIES